MAGQKLEKIGKRGRAAVAVLGDIGRSPRRQYHALSLARQALIRILENRSIRIHKMTQLPVPHGLPKILYPVILLCKVLAQFFMLLWFLCYKIPAPDIFIVQVADGSLCVTKATQHELTQNWEIKATLLYDQPPEFFHPTSLEKRHKLCCRLNKDTSHPHGFCEFVSAGTRPKREIYEEQIKRLCLIRVAFHTMWLAVVDMFGCGLPVCAVSFSCIEELVKDGKNGLLFSSSSELADELLGFPDQCYALKSLKNGVLERRSSARWANKWDEHVVTKICK
ncbi:hypothetical protein MKX01_015030 [Papaver californicum]|nr:hypothetical protein MKX01_015030 [Papaver californicum]